MSKSCFLFILCHFAVGFNRLGLEKNIICITLIIKIWITITRILFMLSILFIVCKNFITLSYVYTFFCFWSFHYIKFFLSLVHKSCTLFIKIGYRKYTYYNSKCLLCGGLWSAQDIFLQFGWHLSSDSFIIGKLGLEPVAVLPFNFFFSCCSSFQLQNKYYPQVPESDYYTSNWIKIGLIWNKNILTRTLSNCF